MAAVETMSNLRFLKGEPYETLVSKQTLGCMLVGYLLMIVSLRWFMKGRKPYALKGPMLVYNVLQVALNIYMIYGLIVLSSIPNIFGLNIQYSARLEYFVFVHYLSKYLDFLDTAFIILRGKEGQQLSFLHVYHHASIGLIWGALLHIGHGNATASFGCLINSFIHCIMYSHYLWTSLGYDNPFKKLITKAQLIQFAMCIVHAILCLTIEKVFPNHLAWAQFIYHIQMLVLFGHFYRKSYLLKKKGDVKAQ